MFAVLGLGFVFSFVVCVLYRVCCGLFWLFFCGGFVGRSFPIPWSSGRGALSGRLWWEPGDVTLPDFVVFCSWCFLVIFFPPLSGPTSLWPRISILFPFGVCFTSPDQMPPYILSSLLIMLYSGRWFSVVIARCPTIFSLRISCSLYKAPPVSCLSVSSYIVPIHHPPIFSPF